jgi:chromosome segregation ATPase
MNITRFGENRRKNAKRNQFGLSVASPQMEAASPIDARMTPIRKSLFQKRRLATSKRKKEKNSFMTRIDDDSRDESNDIEIRIPANMQKNGHLKVLQDRFNHIQKGLGSIDEERTQLVEKAKQLDKEKRFIQKQLELREREILALIRRCASQEEKMRESSKLRSTNRDLQKDLEVMVNKLEVMEARSQVGQSLKKLLQDSELEREQLRERLAKVQREHDAIADTLQECLGNIRQLTEEKHAIEEERRSERKQIEIEFEKQHSEHVNNSNSLKKNIQNCQSRIHQMETLLQDKVKSNTDLRREKAVMSQGQQEEIQKLVEEYERQLQELRNEIEETMMEQDKGHQHGTQAFEEELSFMKEKLKSKDDVIRGLEIEFSDQMEKLITKQSSLDEAEEEKRDLESKVESTRKLEIEHAALLHFVEILDSNLAELTTTNAYLELEKDDLREETDELRKKASILQKQVASFQNNHKAKESDFRELLNADKEELRIELQESVRKSKSEIVSLKAELESRNEYISELEIELNQARRLIDDKEDEIILIMNQMENLRSNTGADLRKARLQVAQCEAEVFVKNQNLASLEGRLEGAKEIRDAGKNIQQGDINNIESERADLIASENEIECLREQLQSTETDSKKVQVALERTIQEARNESTLLRQKIESLSEEKCIIEKEVEESRSVMNGRDEQIIEVQEMVLKHEKRAHDLERKLQYTTKDLEEHKQMLSEIANKESANNYKKLEERIRMLEKELLEAQISRSHSTSDLEEAQTRIEELEKRLIGEDELTESLQNQLQDATNELLEEKSKAHIMETAYNSTTQLQLERESHDEETRFKISIMEDKIKEMEKQSNDQGIQIEDSRKENNDKDKMISSLKVDIIEGQEETKELRSELRMRCADMEKIKLLLNQKDKDHEMKIETTNGGLKSKENRIVELEKILSSNEENVKSLQDSLSKAKDSILQLEDRIRLEEDKLNSTRAEMKEKDQIVDKFNASTRSLKEVTEKASNEITRLTETADNLKLDVENAKKDVTTKDDKIKFLEESLKAEKESRMKLEGEIAVTREYASESQKVNEDLKKELDEKKLGNSTVEEMLSETRKALEELNLSSCEHVSSLENQILQMKADLTRKDIEIRDLRLVELMGTNNEQRDQDTDSLRKTIDSLQSSKQELELYINKLTETISHRDATIEELNGVILQSGKGEAEIWKEREALCKAESEARNQLENIKAEYQRAAACEKELLDRKLKKKDSLHKEELENILFELESTMKKLLDSESLLSERGCRLVEMADHTRDVKLELEKEQTRRREIESKFIREQNDLETVRADLKKVQVEILIKESFLESKLKEERNQKKCAEESLQIARKKYKKETKTRRDIIELERENGELKGKIRRQEAYLQRKLQKEKADRVRCTPSNIVTSPDKSVPRTPTQRTKTSSSKDFPRPTISRSRLQAPSSISGISTGIPSIRKSRPKITPTAASSRSTRTTRSVSSRNTHFQTPSKQEPALSPRDILQSELGDDRSVASELSSILRSPKAKATNSPGAKVPDWELEPIKP